MQSLKDLRSRLKSIKSTQKITKAMQLVAAAKLKKIKDTAVANALFAGSLESTLHRIAVANVNNTDAPKGLVSKASSYLLVLCTTDKGLCGPFNLSILKLLKKRLDLLKRQNSKVKILCLGSKGIDFLQTYYPDIEKEKIAYHMGNKPDISDVDNIVELIKNEVLKNNFNCCMLYYSQFKNALVQTPTEKMLLPIIDSNKVENDKNIFILFEPSEEEVINNILDYNLKMQIYSALIQNVAGENGARMTAMDNATSNANDIIQSLTLRLNRTRQALITKELIEIISGAESL